MSKENLFQDIEVIGGGPSAIADDGSIDITTLQSKKVDEENPPKPGEKPEEIELPDENILNIEEKDTSGSQQSSPFSSLAKGFIARGYLSDDEKTTELFKDVKTMDEFVDVYDANRKDISTDTLNENQKKYLKALESGVPESKFAQYTRAVNSLEALKDNDFTNETIQRQLLTWDYTVKLGSQEEAKEFVELALKKSDVGALTKEASKRLVTFNKTKLDEEIASGNTHQQSLVEVETKKLDDVKDYVTEKEIFPKLQLNDNLKQQVIDAASKIVAEDTGGKPMNALMQEMAKHPVETNAKLAYLWVLTKGLKNLSNLKSSAMTDATKAMEELAGRSLTGGVYDNENPDVRARVSQKGKALTDAVRLALG